MGGDNTGDHEHGPKPIEVRETKRLGPPRKHVVLSNGVSIACIDEGAGEPIIFLHGFPTSSALFRGVIGELEDTYRCLAPDLLGYGDSLCPVDGDLSLNAQADIILEFADELALTSFILVGHDWGGTVAQLIAGRAPERVAALVLLNCPGIGYEIPQVVKRLAKAARVSAVFDLVCETGAIRRFAHSKAGVRSGAYDPTTISDAFVEHTLAPLYKDAPPAYRAGRERFRRALLTFVNHPEVLSDAPKGLSDFEKPTVLVWGCDDPYISVSYAKQLADAIPGCIGLELIAFTGHWVPEEKPQELAAILREHLSAILAPV
ncbi:MAG: alpha/beta fold hydrolase [Planctomycetota bacterium]|jgi:pimeloyl-ACP methyl ester carboxylesterase